MRERRWGRPRRRGGTRSSSNRGRSSSWSALPGTTGSPLPPGKRCRGHCLRSGPPMGVIRGLSRIRRIWTPPTPLELKDCLGVLEMGGVGGRAHVHATVAVGCWIGGSGGAGQPGRGGRRLSAPRGATRPPGVHTPSPVPLPLRARHLPRHRA